MTFVYVVAFKASIIRSINDMLLIYQRKGKSLYAPLSFCELPSLLNKEDDDQHLGCVHYSLCNKHGMNCQVQVANYYTAFNKLSGMY